MEKKNYLKPVYSYTDVYTRLDVENMIVKNDGNTVKDYIEISMWHRTHESNEFKSAYVATISKEEALKLAHTIICNIAQVDEPQYKRSILTEREKYIMRERNDGKTYKDIGIELGLSGVRVSQIYHDAAAKQEHYRSSQPLS